jgi:List-Bact-rpt repeat protein
MRTAFVALVLLACIAVAAPSARAASAWCGTDTVAADRLPEAVSSNQIHVIYAFPSDGGDRFAALAPAIVTDLTAIDTWWRGQDPSRTLRFDLFAFPNCPPGLGNLDLSRVQLPRESTVYAPLRTRFPQLVGDLSRTPFTFEAAFKKYLVFYDGPVEEPGVCGESPVRPDGGGMQLAFSLIFLGARCPQDLGAGSIQAAVVAHELTHNLGALVFQGPPHACPQDFGHPCDLDTDLMYPRLRTGLAGLILDAGRDDYYAHSGTWWDVQDSPWLVHVDAPQLGLSVSLHGSTGSGTVKSDRPGIDCPQICSIAWEQGTTLTLAAEASRGSRFAGWSGACQGLLECEVTVDAEKAVSARFARQVRLRVRVVRRGRSTGSVVSSPAGINCPAACARDFDQGVRIVLRAKPRPGSRFAGWAGACRGTGPCSIRLDANSGVRAVFRRRS